MPMSSLSKRQRQQSPNSAASVRGAPASSTEGFNDWGGRGYDDFVPGEVTKTAPSGDETT